MVHPSYPGGALGRRWRVSYKRKARRLLVVAGVSALITVAVVWLTILYASEVAVFLLAAVKF